jgi:hypothetical protein
MNGIGLSGDKTVAGCPIFGAVLSRRVAKDIEVAPLTGEFQ